MQVSFTTPTAQDGLTTFVSSNMRYYWHFIIGIGVIGAIVLVFFLFSLRVRDNVNFTDTETPTTPTVTFVDPTRGPSTAKVTIVDFGDYQCDGCKQLEDKLASVLVDFPSDVRVVWKDMPNDTHAEATNAAIAARCAGEQDKFWEYHDALFANQATLGAELYGAIASELGLRERAFTTCVTNKEAEPIVTRTYEEGLALQLTVTPTIYINGERYSGDVELSTLKAVIRGIIAAP